MVGPSKGLTSVQRRGTQRRSSAASNKITELEKCDGSDLSDYHHWQFAANHDDGDGCDANRWNENQDLEAQPQQYPRNRANGKQTYHGIPH